MLSKWWWSLQNSQGSNWSNIIRRYFRRLSMLQMRVEELDGFLLFGKELLKLVHLSDVPLPSFLAMVKLSHSGRTSGWETIPSSLCSQLFLRLHGIRILQYILNSILTLQPGVSVSEESSRNIYPCNSLLSS